MGTTRYTIYIDSIDYRARHAPTNPLIAPILIKALPVFATLLLVIHRSIRPLDQRADIITSAGKQGNTDTGDDLDLLTVEQNRDGRHWLIAF